MMYDMLDNFTKMFANMFAVYELSARYLYNII